MDGVINLLKPPGMTSSNAVVFLKRVLNTKKIGHTGTLDPGACGVLAVCVGRATKISDYLMNGHKTYIAEFQFGSATDTLDSYGKVICENSKKISSVELIAVCNTFLGDISQIPPMYSAIKTGGQKLYQLARQGKTISMPPRAVHIYSIQLLHFDEKLQKCLLSIQCSKGTYIRTLCSDIAEKLETCAYMSLLIRTYTGNFEIANSYTLDEIKSMASNNDYSFIIPLGHAVEFMEKIYLDAYLFPIVTTGSPIDLTKISNAKAVPMHKDITVYCADTLIGIGYAQDELLKIKTMLYLKDSTI